MNRSLDWETIWHIERDICFLYHNLSEYQGIDGDQPYELMYNLAYWDVLDSEIPEMSLKKRLFLCNGCLMMILAMAWDVIEGSGSYLVPRVAICQKAISSYQPENLQSALLVRLVVLALDRVTNHSPQDRRISLLSWRANRTFVGGYFKETRAVTSRIERVAPVSSR